MGSVRNAQKAITPIVAIDPNAKANRQRLGKVVLEVADPDAHADQGEQLSLSEIVAAESPHSTRTKSTSKTTRTRAAAASKVTAGKVTAGKVTAGKVTAGKVTANKVTASQARQKSAIEASLKVPIGSEPNGAAPTTGEPATDEPSRDQLLTQVQQLGSAIEQLQSRLEHLNHQSTPLSSSSPLASDAATTTPNSPTANSPNPRLPDWSEPKLRPHYTLKQARTAYEALEQQEQQRLLQMPAPTELQDAQTIAEDLRQTGLRQTRIQAVNFPATPPRAVVGNDYAQRRQALRQDRRPIGKSPAASFRPSRRRYRWDAQRFVANVQQLVVRLMPLPVDPVTKLVDAAAWVLAAIGMRLVFKLLVQVLPFLGWPVTVLLAIPAMIAAYLAFCVEDSRSDVIYRLLLLTVGLFLGSRL
jgi:hypothetical protein